MGQRAVIYARISTSDQPCDRQIADLADFAERSDYDVIDTFEKHPRATK